MSTGVGLLIIGVFGGYCGKITVLRSCPSDVENYYQLLLCGNMKYRTGLLLL